MPIAVIIEWYGPYEGIETLKQEARTWPCGKTLYMALGKYNKYRYIGLTKNPEKRFKQHPKLLDENNKRFYIGEIVTQGITGPRNIKKPPDLTYAEWVLIRWLDPELNVLRRDKDPDDSVSVFSHFYDGTDYESPINKLPKFPKLLGYDPNSGWYCAVAFD